MLGSSQYFVIQGLRYSTLFLLQCFYFDMAFSLLYFSHNNTESTLACAIYSNGAV